MIQRNIVDQNCVLDIVDLVLDIVDLVCVDIVDLYVFCFVCVEILLILCVRYVDLYCVLCVLDIVDLYVFCLSSCVLDIVDQNCVLDIVDLQIRDDRPGPLFIRENRLPLTRSLLTSWLRPWRGSQEIIPAIAFVTATVAARNPDQLIRLLGKK
ncbi:hypothetical protein QZH41_012956 [Actinostola sp. cb2023]|nr:hypothetical protein QZH41_012956 [Actinostola sp. cb2023]